MADETPMPEKVRFVYQKARHHRTLHASGAWAGVTPQLEVQVALFNDLRMMPNEVTNLVTEAGGIGDEVSDSPPGHQVPASVLREVDITIVLNKETAKTLIGVLGQMVQQIDNHLEKATKKAVETPANKPEAS